jgi:divalent metal cation (Fe/Co/Zn/Cd) transporter
VLPEQLDYFLEVDELLSETEGRVAHTLANEGSPLLPISRASKDAQEARRRTSDNTAININLGINIALLALKILVVVLSDSLSLLASAVDSGMDFLSTLIIGVCIFAVLMVAAFFQIFIESVQRLWNFSSLSIVDLPLVAILSMVVTILVKAVVWLIYRSRTSTSVRALAQDAKVDVIFNAFSLFFPVSSKPGPGSTYLALAIDASFLRSSSNKPLPG